MKKVATYCWISGKYLYPFGEVLPGRNSNPTGMFGYQGQERVSNATNEVSGSRWYNFNLRMYNPSLGRFNTIDPYSQFNSPYLAMANNPISFVDPDGGRAVITDEMRIRLMRGLRERAAHGEYYGRPLEYLRHWQAINENEYFNFGGGNVTIDEIYAYGAQFGMDAMYGRFGLTSGFFEGVSQPMAMPGPVGDFAGAALSFLEGNSDIEQALNSWSNDMFKDYVNNGFLEAQAEHRQLTAEERDERRKTRKEKRDNKYRKDAKDDIEKENPLPGNDVYASKDPLISFDVEKIHQGIYYAQIIDKTTGKPYPYYNSKKDESVTMIEVTVINFKGPYDNLGSENLNTELEIYEKSKEGYGVYGYGFDINTYGREEAAGLFTRGKIDKLESKRIYYRYMFGTPNNFEWRYGSYPCATCE